jgi:murein DD-endopeptidase MepM/ murein hydrolase activator NlpD
MKFLAFMVLSALLMIPATGTAYAQEATPESTPALEPVRTSEAETLQLDLYFRNLQQGRVGLVGLRGDNIESATASIFIRQVDFFRVPGHDGLFALLAASTEQPIRTYQLSVDATLTNGNTQTIQTSFDVINGGFIRQTVTLVDNNTEALLDAETEADELERIFELATPKTPDILWDDTGFGAPIDGELTSPFGAVRIFNGTYESWHTGWDFNAIIGEPMVASAAGEVAFAGQLPLRGNYILLNHGQGVYSGYAHLSVIHVTQGQSITAGQVLGRVGSTGRSSSAHAHIEFIVDGQWVDAADFIRMQLP